MEMHLAGVPVYTIMLIGRWSRDAFFAQHQKTSQAILSKCHKVDSYIRLFLNDPGQSTSSSLKQRSPTLQPPQQWQDKMQYWMRQVTMSAAASFLSVQLIHGQMTHEQ
jgi:hypothetical protein